MITDGFAFALLASFLLIGVAGLWIVLEWLVPYLAASRGWPEVDRKRRVRTMRLAVSGTALVLWSAPVVVGLLG